jgi:hypothetical protein
LKISYDFFQKSRDLKTTKELLLVPYWTQAMNI